MAFLYFAGSTLGFCGLKLLSQHNCIPALVITNPEDTGIDLPASESVKKLAAELGIPHMEFKKFITEGYKCFEGQSLFGISAFCSRIIPRAIIDLFSPGITNLHFSLLPKYRGQYPTMYAIFNGDTETGVTLHWIDSGTDSGPIIEQINVPIYMEDTGESLFNKCLKAALVLFAKQIDYYKNNNWPPAISHDPGLIAKSQIHFTLPNEGKLDWSWPGHKIHNFLRAYVHSHYPMPPIELANKHLYLLEGLKVNS